MGATRVEVEKYDGKGDFNMWRKKMKAVLVHQKCSKALGGARDMPATMTAEEKEDMQEIAFSLLILHLTDNVLRQVDDETTAAGVWLKLESLFMTKSLSNKIYLKEKLFGFKMDCNKSLDENLDEFKKITISLANTDEKISDENQAIILLNALPDAFKDVKAAIKYGRESLSLEDVLAALRSKELEINSNEKAPGVGLNVVGKSKKKSQFNKNKGNNNNPNDGKDQGKQKLTCWLCHKEGHLKRNCPEKGKQQAAPSNNHKTEYANLLSGYESGELLVMSENRTDLEWVMDSGCSFHMTPMRELLSGFKPLESGNVLMGNGETCQVTGIGSVSFKMGDGKVKILRDVRLVPTLRRNLISLGMLDLSGYNFKSEKGTLKVVKGSRVDMVGRLVSGLYILDGEAVGLESLLALDRSDLSFFWGYPNFLSYFLGCHYVLSLVDSYPIKFWTCFLRLCLGVWRGREGRESKGKGGEGREGK